ncbi:hypothetical protein BDV38DRAFT_280030 [Aspergillus pseudotamarii]|uniref:Uncharacterized protein n=1 Tax=Aspergillus pseudotamarii TaxID=132259 RepID=A0A5N6T2V6_ASPPS|nr:uncharacterized protein BDV38DRAFT_280030 [Aspergillus pseudotamarii]KAE8140531.1 hypothetical protein BDV38DRAFT_280030 [Aspergillus pseudotamarii]
MSGDSSRDHQVVEYLKNLMVEEISMPSEVAGDDLQMDMSQSNDWKPSAGPTAQIHHLPAFSGRPAQQQANRRRPVKATGSRVVDEVPVESDAQSTPDKVSVSQPPPAILPRIGLLARDAFEGSLDTVSVMVRSAFSGIRYPLQFILVLYLMMYILLCAFTVFYERLAAMVCNQPALSYVPRAYGFCNESVLPPPSVPLNFTQSAEAQEQLGMVSRQAGEGANLAFQIKSNQHAVRDLAMRVRLSDLDNGEAITQQLGQVIYTSKPLVRVRNTVIARDNYALKTLNSIQALRHSPLVILLTLIDPFGVLRSHTILAADETELRRSFVQTVESIAESIPILVENAEGLLQDLDILEEAHNAISDLTSPNDIPARQRDILTRLWDSLTGEDANSALLKDLTKYYKQARLVVTAVMVTLRDMQDNMEEFRDIHKKQVFLDSNTPLEVHMGEIRRAVDSLNQQMPTLDGRQTWFRQGIQPEFI